MNAKRLSGRWVGMFLAAAVLLSGCATQRVAYSKPGVTDDQRKRDTTECVQAAIGHTGREHVLVPVTIDREAVKQCLESRGYTAAPR
jgi:hypothetical protein